MSYPVVITDPAIADLRDIRDYIAKRSPLNAARFLERLLRELDVIETAPDGFGVAPENDLVPYTLHQFVIKPYRIFYRIEGKRIEILHLRHGARRRARGQHFP